MRKALLITSELTYSGTPNSTLRFGRALKKAGFLVEVWSYEEGPFRDEFNKNGIYVDIVNWTELRSKRMIKRIKQFDFAVANSILTSQAFEAIRAIIPTYWYIREAENIPDFFRNQNRRGALLQGSSNIITVSEYAAGYIKEFFNGNVQVIHNCVDDYYVEDSYPNSNEKIRIVLTGLIERRKNQLLLLEAYSRLPISYKKMLEIHFIGREADWEKGYVESFQNAIENNHQVFYHGEIREKEKLFELISSMDLVAVISSDESCSLTALEGAMMAKPLLLSKNVGAKYLVDESNGWIVNTDDVDDLVNVLIDVCIKKSQLKDMGEISRDRYEKTSTFDIYCENVQKFANTIRLGAKPLYRIGHYKDYLRWYYDPFDKYYKYPLWGSENEDERLYSFDVFDTLITRKVASPLGIFALMQNEIINNKFFDGLTDYARNNFVDLRIGAENLARTVYCVGGTEDKTFSQIYEMLKVTGVYPEEYLSELKQMELELERKNSIPIFENIERVKALISEGKRVVLISDMYLPASFIRELLMQADSIFANTAIYVSSECKKMKCTSGLFKYVQNKEKVSFKNWIHIGDNSNADYDVPTSLGIECELFRKAIIDEFETRYIGLQFKDAYMQTLMGFSNIARSYGYDNWKVIYAHHLLSLYVDSLLELISKEGYEEIVIVDGFGKLICSMFSTNISGVAIEDCSWLQYVNYYSNKFVLNKQILSFLFANGEADINSFMHMFSINPNNVSLLLKSEMLELDNAHMAISLLEDEKIVSVVEKQINNCSCANKKSLVIGFLKNDFLTKKVKNYKGTKICGEYYYSGNPQDFSARVFCDIFDLNKRRLLQSFFDDVLEEVKSLGDNSIFDLYKHNRVLENGASIRAISKSLINEIVKREEVTGDLNARNCWYISFALTDVLITNKLAEKDALFLLLREKFIQQFKDLPAGFINSFVEIRKETEFCLNEMYRNKIVRKKSLTELYKLMAEKNGIPYELINDLVNCELETYRENVTIVPENIILLHHCISEGIPVYIIEDSLYSKKFICDVLSRIDSVFEQCEFYITSSMNEYYVNSGDFFKRVMTAEHINSNKWLHIGNKSSFDRNGAKTCGVKRNEYNIFMTQYEKNALIEYRNNLNVQQMIGVAKQNRLVYLGTDEEVIGNSLAGPMLYSYVKWVLEDSKIRGIERLLFVARDGFILKHMADIIIAEKGYQIRTDYVYGSRKAWRMPSFRSSDDLEIFFRMAHMDQLDTIDSFAKIFRITEDELIQFIPEKFKYTNVNLSGDDYDQLRVALENNNEFKTYIGAKALEERIKVKKYFDDIVGTDTFAFVELSGSGVTQDCLARILSEDTDSNNKIITYYLNLYGKEREDNSLFLNYLPNKFYNGWIIENLCRAPHGQTSGYREDCGKILPIIESNDEVDALLKHGFMDYFYGVLRYSKKIEQEHLDDSLHESPVLFIKYLKHVTYNPSREVLNFIGDMPFETTGYNDELTVCAPLLSDVEIERIFLTRFENEKIDSFYKGASLDYSIRRLDDEKRRLIDYYKEQESTRIGRKARLKRRYKEQGLVNTIEFMKKRAMRVALLKLGIINYVN